MSKRTLSLKALFIVALLVMATTWTVVGAHSAIAQNKTKSVEERTVISARGVIYTVRFYEENSTVVVDAKNPGDRTASTAVSLSVDGQLLVQKMLNLTSGESWENKWNVEKGQNVIKDNHILTFSTVGSYTTFNFTRNINTSNPGPIPIPKITDIEVTNGTDDGEPSAVAKVTIANPSIQLYSTKLMVHTLGTDGSFYGASVRPGNSITITVELLDEQNAKIAGEARLYVDKLSKQDGAIDQVGFAGRVNGKTKTWNESYEPVRAPWRKNSYQYTNESIDQKGPLERYTIMGVPVVYVALALVALFVVFRKVR